MFNPAQLDLTVWRNAPFPTEEWSIPLDLTGQQILMQVRLWEGSPVTPYIDINNTDLTGDRIEVISIDTEKPETVFRPIIAKDTHELMPAAGKVNEPVTFRYDLLIGPVGQAEVYLWGRYILRTGVTR